MSEVPMPPGLRRTGSPPMHLTTVDSMPMAQGPPSSTIATRPEPLATWLASVGLIAPEGLALGATIGLPLFAMSVCATSCEGTLSAIEARPAEASIDTGQSARRGTTSVKGPGQNASRQTVRIAIEVAERLRLGQISDMGDQRIELRSPLCRIDSGDGRVIRRIGTQSIDRLGWKGHELALAQQLRRPFQLCFADAHAALAQGRKRGPTMEPCAGHARP